MKAESFVNNPITWQGQAEGYLIRGDYNKAANLYEQAIAAEPGVKCHYWHLGLILLLQGEEVEAQTTWLLALADGEPEQVEQWTAELIKILQTEAERREALADYQLAWVLRQHIREICPDNLDNLLSIIQLSPTLEIFNNEELPLSQVVSALQSSQIANFNTGLLLHTLQQVLEFYPFHPAALKFIEACILNTDNPQLLLQILFDQATVFVYSLARDKADKFAELYLQMGQEKITTLASLANLYQNAGRSLESLEFTQQILSFPHTLLDEITANYLTIRGLMLAGGKLQIAEEVYQKYQKALKQLIENNTNIEPNRLIDLLITVVFSPYLKDEPENTHRFRNQVGKFCQSEIQNHYNQKSNLFLNQRLSKPCSKSLRPLRIGYLSTCLRQHSVTWIARWIFQYHDQDYFKIYAYSLKRTNDYLQKFIAQHSFKFDDLSTITTIPEIAEHIYQDKIDVLIDLDSVTSNQVCGVMALKPAPVQVTWLGSDASGLPAIDYFIADPYVLPQSAQDYYAAIIWRLPNTYIAVDGFEVGVPTLRRNQLSIASDAIVYLSCQTAYKRHPNTARLQLRILKEVPNSYLLIKGKSDRQSIEGFFEQIAQEEEVEFNRLRFLPEVPSESVHRANLGIADVVLDTYPYNGATTTLETLWMGIPLVTRVGEQFAARNSYTMMMNAGVTEGIAWTDEEYVEWGIRLGKDAQLRQQISWKLRQSRQTSPLWNAKQFTHEMEKAYEQMWSSYMDKSKT
ncbi:MAG: O-linked N-acetylglucosamine transferase, SPINDLY family protein [Symploca sp. SIO2E6]|nr:O-linked N-acetylglucosamine transferase, SPINDLY family protein [Symploca sp. SIO2E6]